MLKYIHSFLLHTCICIYIFISIRMNIYTYTCEFLRFILTVCYNFLNLLPLTVPQNSRKEVLSLPTALDHTTQHKNKQEITNSLHTDPIITTNSNNKKNNM